MARPTGGAETRQIGQYLWLFWASKTKFEKTEKKTPGQCVCGHGVKFSLVFKQACMSVAKGTCTLLWWCCARAVGGCFWPISPTGIHCQPSHAWCKCTVLQHGDALFCVGFMGVCAPPPKTLFYLEHKVNCHAMTFRHAAYGLFIRFRTFMPLSFVMSNFTTSCCKKSLLSFSANWYL